MKRKKPPAAKPEPIKVTDRNVCAPEYFECAPSSEWQRRVEAFIETMEGLDRVTTVHFDPDSGKLYLASIPASLTPPTRTPSR